MDYFKNLNAAIERYLSIKKTDYAILINGDWGSGKTFYFKHNIYDIIEKFKDKKYKYIYVSLYGTNNFEEITKSIIWKAATGKKGIGPKTKFLFGKLFSVVSDFGFNKFGINDNPLKKYINKIFGISLENLDLENIVLCFDDLERSHISPNKVFGYINDFVEHENIKTFIIGHEEKLEEIFIKDNIERKWNIAIDWINLTSEKDGDELSLDYVNKTINEIFSEYNFYNQIKEKLIGKTIDFKPESGYYDEVVLDNIISNFEDSNYKQLILENKTEITKIFDLNEHNIRSLKHSLDDFYLIYKELNNLDDKLMEKIFYFAVVCTFENKNKDIDLKKVKKVSYSEVYTSYLFETNSVNKDAKEFFNKYISEGIEFEKMNTIINYVMTGYLNIDLFHKEIDQLKAEKIKSNFELVEQFWKLDDEKFKSVLESLTKEIKEGKYKLSKYPQILKKYLTLHKLGLLNLSLEELEQLFRDGIKKSLMNNEPENFVDAIIFQSERLDPKYNELYEKIVKILKEKNEEFKKKNYKEDIDEILEDKKEYETLRDFMQSMNNYADFYLYVDNEKLTQYFKEKNNEELNNIINLLIDKIEKLQIDKDNFDKSEEIKEKLVKLKEEIDREFDFNNPRLSTATIKRLYNAINKKLNKI